MANYTGGDKVVAQRFLNEQFASPEKRFDQAVVFDMFMRSNSLFEFKVDRNREDTPPTEAHYMKSRVRALGTGGRTHLHTGTQGDEDSITPTWITRDATWSETLKLADNKIWTTQDIMNNEVLDAFISFEEGKETLAVDHLYNNRSQVNIATLEGAFDGVNFFFDIDEATNGNRAMQITQTVMAKNKYKSGLITFCDTVSFNKFRFDAAQGVSNSTNLSFQFDNVTYMHSEQLDAKAGLQSITKGFWATVQFGTFGVADWIPMQNITGANFGNEGIYGTMIGPNGTSFAHHTYFNKVDGTSTGGYTQDVRTEHELSIDWAFDNAPLSVAGESTIQFFALT